MKILLIEDEVELAATLHRGLTQEGCKVTLATDGATGLELAKGMAFDFILLDVNLPDMSGFDVCAEIRASSVSTPVIMVTAREEVADRIRGLKGGADDYLPKPFAFEELLARMDAVKRRMSRPQASAVQADGSLTVGDLHFDPRTMTLMRSGVPVQLTVKEMGVLRLLMESPGTVISRTEILRAVWGIEDDPLTNIVEVYLSRLRRKLHALGPPVVENVRGFGYRLSA
ncbi:response regulator transcription factor [Novosphingobium taihuense]|uniref:DNA-binding response OmpR family regulator n=1 Tax=Novosphingobium taihuense TaxID=260085 RepID=A0A7W7AC14_9SPHN|nr:response regulator transcription factor [Novosphingobium taihuense]MBB4613500.1 DNA-binding response OmpR family regulator [Novosphingobium taihuense]TWH79979.1 DNA-binding response OmpR family regulator [Novosphingobium taihuense]